MAAAPALGMSLPALLDLLADGKVHSGERLADALRVSRTAVWKSIARLREKGVQIQAQRREGYRLPEAVEILDAAAIRAGVATHHAAALSRLQLHFEVESTNSLLLEEPPPSAGHASVCLAELQSRGRGRRGRAWLNPFGGGLALSISWHFPDPPRDLAALSLAAGVAVMRAALRVGAKWIALKWPNDIWFEDRKVGGILIEMRSEAAGPAFVVIGIGINVTTGLTGLQSIEATGVRPASLAQACAVPPSRNAVAGAIIDEMLDMLARFSQEGFAPYRQAWTASDALQDRAVQVQVGDRSIDGTARGIDADGGLLIDVDGVVRKFVSGEVSLRLRTGPA